MVALAFGFNIHVAIEVATRLVRIEIGILERRLRRDKNSAYTLGIFIDAASFM